MMLSLNSPQNGVGFDFVQRWITPVDFTTTIWMYCRWSGIMVL